MEVAEIKTELHQKIDTADYEQLKQLYGLINNYMVGSGSEDWNELTEAQKSRMLNRLEQADKDIGNTLFSINLSSINQKARI